MKLALYCGSKHFKFSQSQVIGSDAFPEFEKLSAHHFEIRNVNGRFFVRDLDSESGTALRGKRIPSGAPFEFLPGELLYAGGLMFRLAPLEEDSFYHPAVSIAVFMGLFLLLLSAPSMAHGQAVGPHGIAIVFMTLAFPCLLSAYVVHRWLSPTDTVASLAKFGAAVLVMTALLNSIVVHAVAANTNLATEMSVSKIRYFCLNKFQPYQCVQEIEACPTCVPEFGHMDRREITYRLRTHFREPASE